MNFDTFTALAFRPKIDAGFVYVFFWIADGTETPFYVGQTQSIWGRLNDYYWADFQACTDFRIGEAVKYLDGKTFQVVVKYKTSTNPRADERELIRQLKSEGIRLLNDCRAYDYQRANKDEERSRIQEYVGQLRGKRSEGQGLAGKNSK